MNQPAPITEESLNAEMDRRKREFLAGVPEDVRLTLMQAAQQLADTGIAERAVNVGTQAPDFELPDVKGQPVRLSERLARGPVVLSFYRGGWCPYCNLELAALQRRLPEIEGLGAALIAVSPQTPDQSLSTAERHALRFDVLSDVGDRTARAYGLVFQVPESLRPIYQGWGIDLPVWNGDESWELPIPATYVIDRDATIRAAHVDTDYTRRMEPEAILAALHALAG